MHGLDLPGGLQGIGQRGKGAGGLFGCAHGGRQNLLRPMPRAAQEGGVIAFVHSGIQRGAQQPGGGRLIQRKAPLWHGGRQGGQRPDGADRPLPGQRQPLHQTHRDAQRSEGTGTGVDQKALNGRKRLAGLRQRLPDQRQHIARGLRTTLHAQPFAGAQRDFRDGRPGQVFTCQRHRAIVPFNGQGQTQRIHPAILPAGAVCAVPGPAPLPCLYPGCSASQTRHECCPRSSMFRGLVSPPAWPGVPLRTTGPTAAGRKPGRGRPVASGRGHQTGRRFRMLTFSGRIALSGAISCRSAIRWRW